MGRVIEYANYARLILGGLLLLAMWLGRRLRAAAEVVERARNDLGDDICKDGVHPDECPSCRPMPSASCCLNATKGWEHDPWCPTLDLDLPAVGRARVVASDDLTWQVDLAKFYRDYDTYRTELRLPGERAS